MKTPVLFTILLLLDAASLPAAPVTFIDVSGSAGVSSIPTQSWGGPLWADLNGDGLLDVTLPTHTALPRFWINNGDETFSDLQGTQLGIQGSFASSDTADWHGFSVIDFDNDGDLDVHITEGAKMGTTTKADILYLNNGNGTFTDVRTTVAAGGLNPVGRGRIGVWFDYNRDGYLDLFQKNFGSANLVYLNDANGGLVDVSNSPEFSEFVDITDGSILGLADFNRDGLTDIYVSGQGPSFHDALLMQQPDGSFIDIIATSGIDTTASASRGLAFSDYDNDGDIDIYLAKGFDDSNGLTSLQVDISDRLYSNQGDGTFIDVTDAAGLQTDQLNTWSAVWGDVDNDGWNDLMVAHPGIANIGNQQDKNDDTVTNTYNLLFMNNGDGTFTEAAAESGIANQSDDIDSRNFSIGLGDYNQDGFLDAVFKNGLGRHRGRSQLFRNEGNETNNSLSCVLVGTQSNRHGIGAEVAVETPSGVQTQQNYQGNGGTLYGQSTMPLHFGVGSATSVTVRVTWPNHTVQEITNAGVNQTLTIIEPSADFTIIDINPDEALRDSTPNTDTFTNITFMGTGFIDPISIQATPSDGLSFENITVVSPTEFTADAKVTDTATLGTRNLTFTEGSGKTAVIEDGLTVIDDSAPIALNLTIVDPNLLPRNSDGTDNVVTVTLTGAGFGANLNVAIGPFAAGLHVNSVNVIDDSTAEVQFAVRPDARLGDRDLELTTGDDSVLGSRIITVVSE